MTVDNYRRKQRSKKRAILKEAVLSWSAATGTVVVSRVVVIKGGHVSTIYPLIEYEYTVNGKKYRYNSIQAGDKFTEFPAYTSQADEAVGKYPVGAQVTVYYNPDKPAEATLER